MASEREKAKKAITTRKSDEPELEDTLAQASLLQSQLAIHQEQHRHAETMHAAELGLFGRVLGGESTASVMVAAIVVLLGIVTAIGCLAMAAYGAIDARDFWSKQSERLGAIAMSALAFIFGKSAGRRSK